MQTKFSRFGPRLARIVLAAIVIGITWYVYEDYVRTTAAQNLAPGQSQNSIREEDGKNVVRGVIEMVPTPRGVLIFPGD